MNIAGPEVITPSDRISSMLPIKVVDSPQSLGVPAPLPVEILCLIRSSDGFRPFLNDRQDLYDDRECSIGPLKLIRQLLGAVSGERYRDVYWFIGSFSIGNYQ